MVGGADSIRAASQSILFWGTKLSPNDPPYKKTLPFLLTIQSAAILPSEESTPITLTGSIDDRESLLLCTLRPTSSHQTSLGLVLNEGTTINFRVEGKGDLYLSGYFHIDADDDDELIEEEEDEQNAKLEALRELYPLAEELGYDDDDAVDDAVDDDEDDKEDDEEEEEEKPTTPKKEKEKHKEKPKSQENRKKGKNQDNKKPDQNKQNQQNQGKKPTKKSKSREKSRKSTNRHQKKRRISKFISNPKILKKTKEQGLKSNPKKF